MTTTAEKALDHEQYHETTINLLAAIEGAQPSMSESLISISTHQHDIAGLAERIDTYMGVVVIYSSVMATILSVAALLILFKLYKQES
jgi:hypothetical protein